MLQDLPDRFPTEKLSRFSFGNADARGDKLLDECFHMASPVAEFLRDEASILYGERGTGKSAVFTQLARRRISFESTKASQVLLLPIEEELEYQVIQHGLIDNIQVNVNDPYFRQRLIWELFLLNRILAQIVGTCENVPDELRDAYAQLQTMLGKPHAGLGQILANAEYGVEFSLSETATGKYVPTAKPAFKPNATQAKTAGDAPCIDLQRLRRLVQDHLAANAIVMYVLVDKIDEFVTTTQGTRVQKAMLQGLMECESDYYSLPNVHLKLFMRKDLFRRLDLRKLGRDKVLLRSVELTWGPYDIFSFMARRLLYNYHELLELPEKPRFVIAEQTLLLDEDEPIEGDAGGASGEHRLVGRLTQFFAGLIGSGQANSRLHEGRATSLTESVAKNAITVVFPREVDHIDSRGERSQITVFKYLCSHFALGNVGTTPRMLMMFMKELLEETRAYYLSNPDEALQVIKDQQAEYHLFKRRIIRKAYARFQKRVVQTIEVADPTWKSWLSSIIQSKKRAGTAYTFDDIVRMAGAANATHFARFVYYLTLAGYLQCDNPDATIPDRRYYFPIVFA